MNPAAICERPALCTQRNNTLFIKARPSQSVDTDSESITRKLLQTNHAEFDDDIESFSFLDDLKLMELAYERNPDERRRTN